MREAGEERRGTGEGCSSIGLTAVESGDASDMPS